MKPSGIVVLFWSTGSLLHNHFFSPFLFFFFGSSTNSILLCPGKSTHSSVETLWFWKCQSVGEYIYNMPLPFWVCIQYATCILRDSSSFSLQLDPISLFGRNKNEQNNLSLFSILSGKRRTKCFLYLLKILPSSGTYIWCHRIHHGYRYLVDRLCNGWATTWTGGFILKLLLMMSLSFHSTINAYIRTCLAALVSRWQWCWSTSWDH